MDKKFKRLPFKCILSMFCVMKSVVCQRGWDLGTCGCCAVLIDGEPRLSCLCLAGQLKVKQSQRLKDTDEAHLAPIQTCFATHGGSQYGFCTGFLMSAEALLNENQNCRDEIAGDRRKSLSMCWLSTNCRFNKAAAKSARRCARSNS